MQVVTFYSYKPFLSLGIHKKRGLFITFNEVCEYTATNPIEIGLLRQYAKDTEHFYNVLEAGKGIELKELKQLHKVAEEKLVKDMKARHKAKLEVYRKQKEEHEFYSALRFSDKAFR